jgi:DNA-directed RNA polymerase specialized sigma24 family protein
MALSAEAFAALLEKLDPDRDRAGERYEDLRLRLVKFFEWRRAAAPEELADETMDRVARRLTDEHGFSPQSWPAYVHGFARNVLRESWKGRTDVAHLDTRGTATGEAERESRERALECLDRCLAALPADNRRLVLEYYREQDGAQIAYRQRIAEAHDMPMNALRLRVHRIRARLDKCVRGCLAVPGVQPTSFPDGDTLHRGPVDA